MDAPFQPLTPAEEARFTAAARWSGDPAELAGSLGIPYSELLHWLAQSRIAALLDQHHRFLAHCEANRARQAQTQVSSKLTQDFQDADDPRERRRISTPLLRATR